MESDEVDLNINDFVMDTLPAIAPSEDDELSEYYFESDPLALQMDSDYQKMLRSLVKLQAQRVQVVQDLEQIQQVREDGLKDPIRFVTDLLGGKHRDLPGPLKIEPLPVVNIDKYDIGSMIQGIKPVTRKQTQDNSPVVSSDDEKEGQCAEKVFVRGREYNESKPLTFNQPWTDEEQRRLDELLIKYPDEKIASQRYLKISKELGTRTVVQVQSRVQKYFVALKREGLPVPGRAPCKSHVRKATTKRRICGNSSTSIEPDFTSSFMKAYNFDSSSSGAYPEQIYKLPVDYHLPNISDEEEIAPDLRTSREYKEISWRRKLKKLKIEESRTGVIKHIGFSCDVCHQEPIIGKRWHCLECPDNTSTDFCNTCVKSDHLNDTHLPTHVLKPIEAMCIRDTLHWLRETDQ